MNVTTPDAKALKAKNSKLGVGEFKNLTGVSRKYAIPLLEYLDRERVTRRQGDARVILLTGWGSDLPGGLTDGELATVDLILSKPVRGQELLQAVARLAS